MTSTVQIDPSLSKYRVSRKGRKLQISNDPRTLPVLPKDVPERIWAEIIQRDENELIVLDIREEIVDLALSICYERYMEKQTVAFMAHCAAEAWLKLIDWQFYRHDPSEEPSAYPPCYIPNRVESWIPDEPPDPSPKDTWASQDLNVVEEAPEETIQRWPSVSSLELPVIDEIPSEYWFPGKINWPEDLEEEQLEKTISYHSTDSEQHTSEEPIGAESEVLQKVTDYSTDGISAKESSTYSALKTTTPVRGSIHGAGDSAAARPKKRLADKCKLSSKASVVGRSRGKLPPLDVADSRSHLSIISDCRLRNLRVETQHEVSSEKFDTPPGEGARRK